MNWNHQQKIFSSDISQSDYFGFSVDIDGSYIVAGAHLNDDTQNNSGSAYIFKRSGNTWSQTQKLVADDPNLDDNFGKKDKLEISF